LKLRASGLKIPCTPGITAYHHELKSRGLDHLGREKHARKAVERTVMEERWGAAMMADQSVKRFGIWRRCLFACSRPRRGPGSGRMSSGAPQRIHGCRRRVSVDRGMPYKFRGPGIASVCRRSPGSRADASMGIIK
jgi:hypothetical protein